MIFMLCMQKMKLIYCHFGNILYQEAICGEVVVSTIPKRTQDEESAGKLVGATVNST